MAITFVNAGAFSVATSGNLTPALPTGTTTDDLLVLVVAGRPTGATEVATPTGYTAQATRLQEVGANDLRLQVFTKFAGAGETAPTVSAATTGWTGTSAGTSAHIVGFRGVDTTTPLDV